MLRPRPAAVAAALAAAAGAFATAAPAAVAQTRGGAAAGRNADASFDIRDGKRRAVAQSGRPSLRPPSAATRSARRALGRSARLEIDPLTGTPRVLGKLNGTLTPPARGDRLTIARRYISDHVAELGLTRRDVESLRLTQRTISPGNVESLRFRQYVDGIPAFDNEVKVNVTGNGSVVNVLGAPQHDLDPPTTSPALGPREALAALMRHSGVRGAPALVSSGPSGSRRETRFDGGDMARLVVFGEGTSARLAWHVTYWQSSSAWYDAVVDARTGEVLRRVNLVKDAANASVWEQYPGALGGGQASTVDLEGLGYLASGATNLAGPNAHAWSDVNDNDVADAGEDVGRSGGNFIYQFKDYTPGSGNATPASTDGACTDAARCSWNHDAAASTKLSNRRQNTVQAFYYVNRFHDHLEAAPIGFDAADGNFEGLDRVLVQTLDGANTLDSEHVDNANMATPPDGQSPTMQMYLFLHSDDPDNPSPFRDVNGGDDAAIVYHEYAHGLSSRLITLADGSEALDSPAAGAMGEAWSDYYAKDFLTAGDFQLDTATPGEVDMGVYTDATPRQIRTQPLDCPVGTANANCPGTASAGSGGYTFADFGRVLGYPEVHADGEIWGETLWDLRSSAIGAPTTLQLVTQAMRLSPPEPTFLEMRNAILQADTALFSGAHHDAIWQVFAHRGMGYFAAVIDAAHMEPVQDTQMPPVSGQVGRVSGKVTDADTGAALSGVAVSVAGLTNGPDAITATTASNGTFTLGDVPAGSAVKLVSDGPTGYDTVVRSVSVADGATANGDIGLRRDWASQAGGASIRDSSSTDTYALSDCGRAHAIDQTRMLGWSADFPSPAGTNVLTLRLPANVDVSEFTVDPSATCTDGAEASVGSMRIETSADGVRYTTAATPAFDPADNGHANVVHAAPTNVRFVRVTMLEPQDTVASSFVDLSEFRVHGTEAVATPTPNPTSTPTVTPTPTISPTPTPTPSAKPVVTISRSGTKGKIRFVVKCDSACSGTAKLTISKKLARRLGLGRKRTLVTRTVRLSQAGTKRYTLKLSRKVKSAMKRKHVRRISTKLRVRVRDAEAQSATKTRSPRIRR